MKKIEKNENQITINIKKMFAAIVFAFKTIYIYLFTVAHKQH